VIAPWRTVPLRKVVQIDRSTVAPKDIEKGTTYVGLENIDSNGHFSGVGQVEQGELASGKFIFTEHHVLYGKLRPYLAKIARPNFRGVCSTDILPLLPGTEVCRDFLAHYLRQPCMVEYATSRSAGANLPRLSPNVLGDFKIPLPPLPDQRRIAAILDRADDLRAKRRAALAQLDGLAQSVFLDMLGDPVANPRRWPDAKVEGVLTFQQYGPRFFNERYSDSGTRIVRITDLGETGVLDFDSMPRLAVSSEDHERYALKPGDLIFARSGATVGKVALIRPSDPPCIAGAYFIAMRFAPSVTPEYAHAVFMSAGIRKAVARRSRQAAQQNFSGPSIRQLPFPVPPLTMQLDFGRVMSGIDSLKHRYRPSFATLESLFASLQHRAFRGEL
jgi:type I restriction enzyme S subunit